MSKVFDGVGAAEGIGAGRVHILTWGVPDVPHQSVEPEAVEDGKARTSAPSASVRQVRERSREVRAPHCSRSSASEAPQPGTALPASETASI